MRARPSLVIGSCWNCAAEGDPSDAKDIVHTIDNGHKPLERLLYLDPVSGQRVVREDEVPFYRHQQRAVV
jgi:hypothetical protein